MRATEAFVPAHAARVPSLRRARRSDRCCRRTTPRAVAVSGQRDSSAWQPAFVTPVQQSASSPTHLLTIVWESGDPMQQLQRLAHDIVSVDAVLHAPRRLSVVALDVALVLPAAADVDALRTCLFRRARLDGADAVLQHVVVARARKRLAVFDLDSTLIAQETIDELAGEQRVMDRVRAITERAMNGEIGFRDALAARVALLEGLPLHALDAVKHRVRFTPGAQELIATLRALDCTTAVVSGGFHFLADHVRDVLGLDYSFANRLETDENGVLTGRTVGEIVDGEYKERVLRQLASEKGLSPEQILAVGDGSNDLLMMHRAGLGVAFNAKPIVQDRAKCRVNQPSLKTVLYLLGHSDEDIDHLISRQLR